jgi:hypothetical protein
MSRGLQADAHYTWSRTRDMATHSNGGGQTMDNYDIWRDYGPAAWDVPHRFVATYLYDIPFFRTSTNSALRHTVGGWQISGLTTIQSGTPINITMGGDRANIGISNLQRPNLVGAVPSLNCEPNSAGTTDVARRQLVNCFDRSAFALPPMFTFGDAPRNLLRGPRSVVTDLSLMKNFPLGGSAQFQFRAELFNVFNTVNYGNPNAVFTDTAAFGRITSAGSMRQVQLGGRVVF